MKLRMRAQRVHALRTHWSAHCRRTPSEGPASLWGRLLVGWLSQRPHVTGGLGTGEAQEVLPPGMEGNLRV